MVMVCCLSDYFRHHISFLLFNTAPIEPTKPISYLKHDLPRLEWMLIIHCAPVMPVDTKTEEN